MLKKHKKPKKRGPAYILLRDAAHETMFYGRIDALTVPDARIVELSIRYFNDPAPCFIHQGAVLSRIHGELEDVLGSEDCVALDTLDPELRAHLAHYTGARDIQLVREELP